MRLPSVLEMHDSRFLCGGVLGTHGLALAVALLLPSGPALAVALLIAGSGLLALKREVPRFLALGRDGLLTVQYADGREVRGRVLPSTAVLPWIAVIALEPEDDGRRLRLTITPDALTKDGFRHLRLWLKWKASAARGR